MGVSNKAPQAVVDAASVTFAKPITGILYLPELDGFRLIGNMFYDRRCRFADGRLIRTSAVLEFTVCSGYYVAQTVSGSRYVLVSANGCDVFALLGGRFDQSAHHC